MFSKFASYFLILLFPLLNRLWLSHDLNNKEYPNKKEKKGKKQKQRSKPDRRVIAAARLLSIPCQSHRADIAAACEYLISECVLRPSELNANEYWHLLRSLEYGIMLRWAEDTAGNPFVLRLPCVPGRAIDGELRLIISICSFNHAIILWFD